MNNTDLNRTDLDHAATGLWQSLTPVAQSVDRQAQQAEQVSKITNVIIIGIAILFALLSLIIFVLANSIKGRSLRIEQRIF